MHFIYDLDKIFNLYVLFINRVSHKLPFGIVTILLAACLVFLLTLFSCKSAFLLAVIEKINENNLKKNVLFINMKCSINRTFIFNFFFIDFITTSLPFEIFRVVINRCTYILVFFKMRL